MIYYIGFTYRCTQVWKGQGVLVKAVVEKHLERTKGGYSKRGHSESGRIAKSVRTYTYAA